MHCPACARPVAMARGNCLYCGAALSIEVLEEAARAAERILQSSSLRHLEAATGSFGTEPSSRRYLVIDTSAPSLETLAEACSISLWDARQWQAASRYRLVKVSTEPEDGPLESELKKKGLKMHVVPEHVVAQSRNPILIEAIDLSRNPSECTLRDAGEGPTSRRELKDGDVVLVVSAFIKREKVKDQTSLRNQIATRLEDFWLVHLHLKGENRPWEMDPRRTRYEGDGLPSAHMRTLEIVRRLSATVPHDESFRNVVPAMSPCADPPSDLDDIRKGSLKSGREPKLVVLDNVAQFREYSAWRGAVEGTPSDRLRVAP